MNEGHKRCRLGQIWYWSTNNASDTSYCTNCTNRTHHWAKEQRIKICVIGVIVLIIDSIIIHLYIIVTINEERTNVKKSIEHWAHQYQRRNR